MNKKKPTKDELNTKRLLKKRKSVICDCKKIKSQLRDRGKYGTCRCDGFSFCETVGVQLSNALYQYIADASQLIIRDDWKIIEKHADAIRAYAEADNWDKLTTVDWEKETAMTRMINYDAKERAFREAMFWLQENWNSLWW